MSFIQRSEQIRYPFDNRTFNKLRDVYRPANKSASGRMDYVRSGRIFGTEILMILLLFKFPIYLSITNYNSNSINLKVL